VSRVFHLVLGDGAMLVGNEIPYKTRILLVGFGYNETKQRVMTAPKGGERPFRPGQRSAIGPDRRARRGVIGLGPGPSQHFAPVCRRE
jgi:hypothetical protein